MRRKQRKPSKVPDQQYRRYKAETLASAYAAVKEKGMAVRAAASLFKVPCQTLRDRVKGKVDPNNMTIGSETMFSQDEELGVVEHLESLAQEGYRYSNSQLRTLAGNLAFLIGKRMTCKPLSKNWITGFFKRWTRITTEKLRYPDTVTETNFYPERLFQELLMRKQDLDASGKISAEEYLIKYKDMLEGYEEPPPLKKRRTAPKTSKMRKTINIKPTRSHPDSEDISDSENDTQSDSDEEYETQSDSEAEMEVKGDLGAGNEVQKYSDDENDAQSDSDDKYITDTELSTSDSEEETNITEDRCCVCQKFSPPNLTDYPKVKKVTWIGCDACDHWVHLMFCYKTRLKDSFLCPHCQQ